MPRRLRLHGPAAWKVSRRGFSLIEVLIVVAIVGILVAVAYPSYDEQIRKARRADAQGALSELAQFMERHYSTTGSYPSALPFNKSPKDGDRSYYELKRDPEASDDKAYTLQAVAHNQMSGDGCGNFSLTHTGLLSHTGTFPVDRCIRR